MAFLILLLFAFVVMPFFALGVKRHWLVAAAFWIPAVAYTGYLWTLPIDQQMAEAWRMIMLAIVVTAPAAFAGGLITVHFARRRGVNLEETFE